MPEDIQGQHDVFQGSRT